MEKVETKNTVVNPAEAGVVEDKATKAREAKNEASRRFTEKKREEAKQRIANAQKFIDKLKADKYWDKVPADLQKWLTDTATPKAFGGPSLFTTLFGDSPKVGDKIKLMDAMTKSLKGKTDIDRAAKGWAEKGVIVEFVAAPKLIDSEYVIKALA